MRYFILLLMILSINVYAQIPNMNIPNLNVPNINTPNVNIPNINMPDMNFSKLDMKLAKINNINFDQMDFSGSGKALGMTSEAGGKLLSSLGISMSASSNNYHPRYKVIINAKPDAVNYIVSNGKLNGAYLQQALMLLRNKYPNTSDMTLAEAIVAY